jgi:hypothetical protein
VPERATIAQGVQIGVESTPGTAVAAAKRLGSIGFTLAPHIDTNANRPMGQKYASLQILNQEWSTASIDGSPSYTELPFVFASLINTPTITEFMDSAIHTGAFKYVFDSNPYGDDTPKTFTIEQGSSVRAARAAGCLITGIELGLSRSEVSISGDAIGGLFEDGVTLTSTPTQLPQIPVRPGELTFYMDDTWAGLGTTKLTRALSGSFKLDSRYGPLWVVDASKPSYVATVETEPGLEASLLQVMDGQGMSNLTHLRQGDVRYFRMEAVGPKIYDGSVTDYYHKLTIDLAAQVSDVAEPSDEDGVYAIEWTLGGVVDSTNAKAFHIEVVTTTATL